MSRVVSSTGPLRQPMARTGLALLTTALLAHVWFASAPWPFGGPNVLLFALAAAMGTMSLAVIAVPSRDRVGLGAGVERLRAIAPVLCVGATMPVVALAVYLWTGTVDVVRLGHMVLGIGVLLAVFFFVDSPRRAKWLALALVFATGASAAFGILVTFVGDPFLSIWLKVASVSEEDLHDILTFGRSAGLASHVSTFGRQLAVAIPLALAALLYCDYPRRSGPRMATAVGFFVLLATLVTALITNNTRSVMLATIAACAVVALPVPRARRARLRLLLTVGPLTAWLFLFFYPWAALSDAAGIAQPSRVGDNRGDIRELRVGVEALDAGTPRLIGHALSGNTPGREYEVQLRERYAQGYGQASGVIAAADGDGRVFMTWRHREGVGYQVRKRPTDYGGWSVWLGFLPSLGIGKHPLDSSKLTLEDVALGYRGEARPAGARFGHRFANIGGDQQQVVQLRLVAWDGDRFVYGAAREVVVPAGTRAPAVITWRHHDMLGIGGFERRVVSPVREEWRPFLPSLRVAPGNEVLPGLQTGTGVAAANSAHRVGHEFGGFIPWVWYVVQIRQHRTEGAVRLGEVVAKPDEGGRIALVWDAPPSTEQIVAHEFRVRDISQTQWLPWQRFEPSLNSITPALEWAAGTVTSGRLVRRHTISGLAPGETYRLQMRSRNQHGYGAESAELNAQADAEGALSLTWTEPDGEVDGHQFRLWWRAKTRWWPWQDLAVAEGGDGYTPVHFLGHVRKSEERLASARVAHELAGRVLRTSNRFTEILDTSAMARVAELGTVLRYVAAHPFGTGVYAPKRVHIGEGWTESIVEELLRLWPHNQFLHVLALFGVPGFLVLVAFYFFLLRAAIRCGEFARHTQDDNLRFLALGVAAAWGAYTLNSLLIPVGPFIGGWSHFLLIGLLFSVAQLFNDSAAVAENGSERGPTNHVEAS